MPTESSRIKVGLQHYAQWGGVSPVSGSQPAGFGDYWKVFFGVAGDEAFTIDPTTPALGNHIGAYQLEYQQELRDGSLAFYHQHLFEDGSGAGFANFPDGVWGVFWELPENSALRGLVYEFVQTTDQSGPPPPPGDDNYFNHYIYESGWTYKTRTIGLPFLIATDQIPAFNNTRVTAHHLGARVSSFDENWDFRFMTSFVKGKGTYEEPFDPEQSVFYGHVRIRRLLNEQMQLGLSLGTDISRQLPDNFAVGLSFRYVLGETLRIIPEEQ